MLRAVFVRTLRAGVSYQQFTDAWLPENLPGGYPVAASVSFNTAADRQVITILEVDASLEEFGAIGSTLTRPDALDRLGEIVVSTELAGVFEQVWTAGVL